MTNLEKIQALKAGDYEKALEGTKYAGTPDEIWGQPFNAARAELHAADPLANAAKVEVTKGVLDEVTLAFSDLYHVAYSEGVSGDTTTLPAALKALTLITKLKAML